MPTQSKDIEAFVDTAAVLVGIQIEPEWRAGVASHLAIIMANAELVAEADCAATTEPAPVYKVDGR